MWYLTNNLLSYILSIRGHACASKYVVQVRRQKRLVGPPATYRRCSIPIMPTLLKPFITRAPP